MHFFNRLVAVVGIAALLGPMLPLEARNHKGDRYLAEGRKHEAKKEWDAALECYEKALATEPSDLDYQMAETKARFQASSVHLDLGLRIRAQGKLGEALLEFQKAYAIDPASSVAQQEIVATEQMIDRERQKVLATGKESPPEIRGLTPLEEARREADQRINRILPVPELRPLNPLPRNMKINNTAKFLFETVAKVAGINVVWDPDYTAPAKNSFSVDFENTTLEQALDNIALITKSFWKPLSPNTIFITNDSTPKHHDYDDQVTQIFYLSNINAAQEIQEMVNVVRSVTQLQSIAAFNSQNAIVVKGEADKVALAEAMIHDLDKPRSETQVDIMVLETDSVFNRQLSAAIATGGLNVPFNFSPRASIQVPASSSSSSTTTTSSSSTTSTTTTTPTTATSTTGTTTGAPIPLSNVGHLSSADWSVVLPNALLQATLSDTKTKVLQAPQLRTIDNVKATMKVGQREPTASGSYQPGVAGVGVNPLVNTQFTYIDVGVNVTLTTHVHDNGDISMEVDLEISNIAGTVNLGGINEPIIGQRKVTHQVRMHEGEVNLIAGLINTSDTKSVTGIPGLSNIPILGKLFSGDTVDRERDEIMIAIIPHIVRRPSITAENVRPKYVGNQTVTKLNYAPRPEEEAAAAPPAGAQPGAPAAQPPAPGGAMLPPATAPGATPGGGTAPPATASNSVTRPATPAIVHFAPGQIDTTPSGTFSVALAVDNANDLSSAQLQLQFDPKILRLNDVVPGGLLVVDGQQPVPVKNIMNDSGTATVDISRTPGSPGVTASGHLLIFHFQAVAKGTATVSVPSLTLRNSQGQVIARDAPQLTVNVK